MNKEMGHMNKTDVEKKIRDLYAKTGGIVDIDLESELKSAPGWDSLRYAEFVIALQNEFKIRMSPVEITALDTLSAALRIVSEKLKL